MTRGSNHKSGPGWIPIRTIGLPEPCTATRDAAEPSLHVRLKSYQKKKFGYQCSPHHDYPSLASLLAYPKIVEGWLPMPYSGAMTRDPRPNNPVTMPRCIPFAQTCISVGAQNLCKDMIGLGTIVSTLLVAKRGQDHGLVKIPRDDPRHDDSKRTIVSPAESGPARANQSLPSAPYSPQSLHGSGMTVHSTPGLILFDP